MKELQAAMAWLAIGQQVLTAGATVWDQIRGVLVANGIDADTSRLDAIIEDAERRKAQAQRDATGTAE